MHVHGRLQATCSRPSAACTHTRWWCHQGVIKYYLQGMCSNSNVWLKTRTQASPAIRGHARTSNHHPSKKYLTTTTIQATNSLCTWKIATIHDGLVGDISPSSLPPSFHSHSRGRGPLAHQHSMHTNHAHYTQRAKIQPNSMISSRGSVGDLSVPNGYFRLTCPLRALNRLSLV